MAGLGSFYGGLLHPLLVLAHLIAIAVLGLLLGQQATATARLAIPAFAAAVLAGLAFAGTAPVLEPALLAAAAACGILVALERRLPGAPCAALAIAVGAMVGADSDPGPIPGGARVAALAGTLVGASLLLLYAAGIAAVLRRRAWPRIAVRVLGSWGAATALLVLALELAAAAPR